MLILKTYFLKIPSVLFLREIEISKKYYLRHYIPNVKMTKKKLILLKIVVNVIFVEKFLVSDSSFICKVTNKKYYIKNDFECY